MRPRDACPHTAWHRATAQDQHSKRSGRRCGWTRPVDSPALALGSKAGLVPATTRRPGRPSQLRDSQVESSSDLTDVSRGPGCDPEGLGWGEQKRQDLRTWLAPALTSAEFHGDWAWPGVQTSLSCGRTERTSRGRGMHVKVTSFLNGCLFWKTLKPAHPESLGAQPCSDLSTPRLQL